MTMVPYMALSILVNGDTGGYELINSKLVIAQSAITKCNILLSQPVGGYIYNLKMGNPLITTKNLLTQNEIINGLNYALQPVLNSGEISAFTILKMIITPTQRTKIYLSIDLPSGESQILIWEQH